MVVSVRDQNQMTNRRDGNCGPSFVSGCLSRYQSVLIILGNVVLQETKACKLMVLECIALYGHAWVCGLKAVRQQYSPSCVYAAELISCLEWRMVFVDIINLRLSSVGSVETVTYTTWHKVLPTSTGGTRKQYISWENQVAREGISAMRLRKLNFQKCQLYASQLQQFNHGEKQTCVTIAYTN